METLILVGFVALSLLFTFGVMVFGPMIRERQLQKAIIEVNDMTPAQINARAQRVKAEVKEQEG